MGCASSAEEPAIQRQDEESKAARAYLRRPREHVPEKPKAERAVEWERVRGLLPIERSPNARVERKSMFTTWDVNGNRKLSLAEIDKACRQILQLENYTNNLAPILIRAYYATLNRNGKKDDDGFVEFLQFRKLLFYVYHYFELMQMFDTVDFSSDRRITVDELRVALPLMQKWGLDTAKQSAESLFDEIDTNKGGFILFEEFCDFGTKKKLDADGNQENEE
jgi:Ca2+-binding EF-hand superfamily protein